MSDKEMNLAILNKLYEIADKVFNEGVNVKEGNYTASDLAKMKDSAPAKDVAESKKMAIEKSVEDKKVEKWHDETLEKLSFLENYDCELDNCNDKSKIHITHGRQMIEIALVGDYRDTDKIWRYDLDKPLKVDWRYDSAYTNDKSELTLEEFVKALVRRGIIKVEG